MDAWHYNRRKRFLEKVLRQSVVSHREVWQKELDELTLDPTPISPKKHPVQRNASLRRHHKQLQEQYLRGERKRLLLPPIPPAPRPERIDPDKVLAEFVNDLGL